MSPHADNEDHDRTLDDGTSDSKDRGMSETPQPQPNTEAKPQDHEESRQRGVVDWLLLAVKLAALAQAIAEWVG